MRDEAGEPQYFFAQFQDITERKRMEQELSHQALHDSLTGLPNRALLTDRLVHGLAGSRRGGSQLGVIFLDVDHFKVVNDSLGHNCGDDLLKVAADRISAAIRPGDTVARFGGDEFVIVCSDVTVEVAEAIAQRVLDSLSQVFLIGDQEMSVTASIGHRGLGRRLDAGEPAAGLRCRDVSGEGPRPGPDRGLRRGAPSQGRAPVGDRLGIAPCPRTR